MAEFEIAYYYNFSPYSK